MSLPTYWVGVGAALGLGGIVGFLAGRTSVEGQVRAEYAQSVEMLKNTFEKAQAEAPKVEAPKVEEEAVVSSKKQNIFLEDDNRSLNSLVLDHEPKPFIETITKKVKEEHPEVEVMTLHEPDYEKAIHAVETPTETFVSGGVNDYGVSFVEDSDYEEENGFFKYRIDIMMDEHNPIFLMDGVPIDDWDKRLGDSILLDFYNLVPPGVNPVLYVRNHAAGEDYEVMMVNQV